MIAELVFVFLARLIDMSLATIRHVFVMRGLKAPAALVGFVEIIVYTVALGLVVSASENIWKLLAFSMGFAAGIVLGITIEDRLALGYRIIQITVDRDQEEVVDELRAEGYSVTAWEASGRDGEKLILSILARRRAARQVARSLIDKLPDAFIVLTEPRTFMGGFVR